MLTKKTNKTSKTKVNKTLTEVKQQILDLVDKGKTYREIAKRAFTVDGKKRRFSISQISKWMKERERKGRSDFDDDRSIASRAFELFEKGITPVRVVIELEQSPELIQELYHKWVEMNGALLIPKKSKDNIYRAIIKNTEYEVNDLDSLEYVICFLILDHLALKDFNYPCNVCQETLYANPCLEWKDLVDKGCLSNWGHKKCHEKQEDS